MRTIEGRLNAWRLVTGVVILVIAVPALAGTDSDWTLTGNAGTTPGTNFVGTTDNKALELRVNGARALKLVPNATSPSVVGGYSGNTLGGGAYGATISGGGYSGWVNSVSGIYGTVGGGAGNTASGQQSTIAGGYRNTASAERAAIAGGLLNTVSGVAGTVGGGRNNEVAAEYGTIAGGGPTDVGDPATRNRVTDKWGTIGGGGQNVAGSEDGTPTNAVGATVAGGLANSATRHYATVSGGVSNSASEELATVGGGRLNMSEGAFATIGGGCSNRAIGQYATVSGGGPDLDDGNFGFNTNNMAMDDYCTVGGGYFNRSGHSDVSTTTAPYATIAGGRENEASGDSATVGGGYSNQASGMCATVPGGDDCTASGDYSFAAGHHAGVTGNGSFLWCDASMDNWLSVYASNKFVARAAGGVTFYTSAALSSGVKVGAGGNAWETVCDRDMKENFQAVNAADVLDKVATMPLSTWNYKSEGTTIRHMGPVAQDMHAAFGLGNSDKTIVTIDADGVALASIQGLYGQDRQQTSEIKALKEQVRDLTAQVETLKALVKRSTAQ